VPPGVVGGERTHAQRQQRQDEPEQREHRDGAGDPRDQARFPSRPSTRST
jgi:hypothetical protein